MSLDELEFTCPPEQIRTVQVLPVDFKSAEVGKQFTIKEDNGVLLIISDGKITGVCQTPPRSILEGISGIGGYGVGKLDRVKEISGLCDVAVYLRPLIKEINK